MAESLPCTAAGADQLPGEVKRLLGQGLPNGASAEYDHGILAGLQFALRLLEAAPLTPEQARTALAAAAGNKKAQVDARNQAELPEVYARLRAEFTAADLAEYANTDQTGMVPSDQLLAELEAIVARGESGNGAVP